MPPSPALVQGFFLEKRMSRKPTRSIQTSLTAPGYDIGKVGADG